MGAISDSPRWAVPKEPEYKFENGQTPNEVLMRGPSWNLEGPMSVSTGLSQEKKDKDPINPSHYKSHPSGIEAIEITQHYNFCVGNAIKYLWRNGLKDDEGSSAVKDLKKAIWYIQREIQNIEKGVYNGKN